MKLKSIGSMTKLKLIIAGLLFICPNTIHAQQNEVTKQHSLIFKPQFFQVKDAFNYGLVYSGFNLAIGYEYEEKSENALWNYSANMAFGPDFGKGIGLNWQFQPFNLFYGFNVSGSSWQLYLGPYISANYIWDIYPFLQSGHLYWCSTYEIGPRIITSFPGRFNGLSASFSAMSFGLTSRPKPATESYFYSMTIGDFITNAHSDMKFGSLDLFDHFILGLEYTNPKANRFSIGYVTDFINYTTSPAFKYLTHTINFKWKIGKS